MGEGCEVWFYHLERSTLEQALPELLEKTLARGWRALVRVCDPDRLDRLDDWLWSWRDDSFLAHGRAGDPEASRQPILLTDGMENPNGAQALFIVDGAELGELDGFARCLVLFDGRDAEALAVARGRWKEVRSRNLAASYWRQSETGRWEKRDET